MWPKNPSTHPSKKAVLDISMVFYIACSPVMGGKNGGERFFVAKAPLPAPLQESRTGYFNGILYRLQPSAAMKSMYFFSCFTGTQEDCVATSNIQSQFSLGKRERTFLFQKKGPFA
ncbi:MAG: hypothetical protein PUE61_10480 [Clostridiales bacterium]|nr:hypothetical protein [Clostridiales bacterium]